MMINADRRHPSFVDLRDFARQRERPAGDPFGAGRSVLPLPIMSAEVGAVVLTEGRGHVASKPGDVWMIVAGGSVRLNALELAEGESCVVPGGAAFDWHAPQPATLIYMHHGGSSVAGGGLVSLDRHAALAPADPPPPELVDGPTPLCRNATLFRSNDADFIAGCWAATPYRRKATRYRHLEITYLTEGEGMLVDEARRRHTFRKGDIFAVEPGAVCSWESPVNIAKVYAICLKAM